MGFYHAQLERYFGTFRQEQIRVYLWEELNANPLGVLQDVFRYLGVDDTFIPDTSRRLNVFGAPRGRLVLRLMERPNPVRDFLKSRLPVRLRRHIAKTVQNINFVEPPPLHQEVRKELIGVYRQVSWSFNTSSSAISRGGWIGGKAERLADWLTRNCAQRRSQQLVR
ncbi:MAG: hypothetical protein M3P49_16040, partial [Actinomycetota bacterium]|nr:hypothetical protein [Actinomycetota bacterium]